MMIYGNSIFLKKNKNQDMCHFTIFSFFKQFASNHVFNLIIYLYCYKWLSYINFKYIYLLIIIISITICSIIYKEIYFNIIVINNNLRVIDFFFF